MKYISFWCNPLENSVIQEQFLSRRLVDRTDLWTSFLKSLIIFLFKLLYLMELPPHLYFQSE